MTAYTSSLSESLTNYDSLSTVMPHWLASTAETLTTSDTLGHQFTAVRPLVDATGASTLGIANLPLLLTHLPFGSGTDLGARQVQQFRKTTETVTVLDTVNDRQSLIVNMSEVLSANDNVTINQALHRRMTDNVPFIGDSSTKRLQVARRIVDQVGNDKLVSPMLLFPVPNNDETIRVAGHMRLAVETLAPTEGLSWLMGFSRHYAETLNTSSTVTRQLNPAHRDTFEMLLASDNVARYVTYQRVIVEQLTHTDASLRLVALHRTLSDTLTTNAALGHHHSAPRIIIDTLTTSDHITAEQLLQAIMGYIWQAQNGSVVADLPDWGYVLIEDPVVGNTMNVVPIPITVFDPTRSK